jgi:hypothetical protein
MIYEELIDRVARGEEFEFCYNNEHYWINQNKEGRYLSRCRDGYTQAFKTAVDLFNESRIEGKSLLEIWDSILW